MFGVWLEDLSVSVSNNLPAKTAPNLRPSPTRLPCAGKMGACYQSLMISKHYI